MTTRTLPEKKYFKIGEVADLVGVEPHVLRYWETQFPQVRPHKARSGHRLYRRREVETLLVIRELLHVQRFTIAGARQALRQPGGAQSLLPRFFDGASGQGSLADGPRDTLVPRPVDGDVTDEDGRDHPSLFDAPGADSAEGELVEVEAHGLQHDELRDALERDAAAGEARRPIVEVEVEAQDGAPRLVRRAPALSLHPQRHDRATATATAAASASASASPARLALRRRLLEEALSSAHAVIAVLDREDSRSRAHA